MTAAVTADYRGRIGVTATTSALPRRHYHNNNNNGQMTSSETEDISKPLLGDVESKATGGEKEGTWYKSEATDQPPTLSPIKLLALCSVMFGAQFAWALQTAYSTSIFLEIGVPATSVGYIRLAGPISGLIVQPLVGKWSDKVANRQNFLYFSGAGIAVALLLMPNSRFMGSNANGMLASITALWLLDVAMNVVFTIVRALVTDLAPQQQLSYANSMIAGATGSGQLVGYLVGALLLSQFLGLQNSWLDPLSLSFAIGALLSTIGTCITVCFVSRHKRAHKIQGSACSLATEDRMAHNAVDMKPISPVSRIPRWMRPLCGIQFLTWFAWFCFIVYGTDWIATDIYGGNVHADHKSKLHKLYNEGLKMASWAMAVNAGVTMITGMSILPFILKYTNGRFILSGANAILALCLIATKLVDKSNKLLALSLLAILGLPWAVTQSLPYAMVGKNANDTERGWLLGVLNIFVVLPQLLVSVISSLLISKDSAQDVEKVLLVGGFVATVACPLSLFLSL